MTVKPLKPKKKKQQGTYRPEPKPLRPVRA